VKKLLALILALGLSACAIQPLQTSIPETWPERQESLLAMDTWIMTSRISLRSGERAWQGSLHWIQNQTAFDIRFRAGLGQGALQLQGDENAVKLDLADGKHFEAASAEELVQRELGWSLPLNYLRYWVRGVPAPEETALLRFDEDDNLVSFDQAGWKVEYRRYDVLDDAVLPGRIAIHNDRLDVRLAIDGWDLPG
jgi:outer membrane lipoprotein LolB